MANYDKTSPESILQHALSLLGTSISMKYPAHLSDFNGKGNLGQLVEKYHFGYEPNSKSEPDFSEAGVELKCTPLKKDKDGSYVSKERLVLNIINYMEEADKTFYTSSFWHKNALLLLMFYLHDEVNTKKADMLFKIIRLWQIPEHDLWMFVNDWNTIHRMIISGKAHELSETMTYYLGACTKGSKAGANKRSQPFSTIKADQRAYSIKSCYINNIILDSINHANTCAPDVFVSEKKRKSILKKKYDAEHLVKSNQDIIPGQTIEDIVEAHFSPYYGQSIQQIEQQLGVKVSDSAKAMAYALCRAVFQVQSKKIGEFEKAGIQVKTIRLEENGSLKESMSFSNIRYKEIIAEDCWDDSHWYQLLNHRFFFVVLRKKKDGTDKEAVLEKTFFWGMPNSHLDMAQILWKDTRDKIRQGDYQHFIKQADNPMCHIRPKARNASDTVETPQGTFEKKMCYWLNSSYILGILRHHGVQVTGKISSVWPKEDTPHQS